MLKRFSKEGRTSYNLVQTDTQGNRTAYVYECGSKESAAEVEALHPNLIFYIHFSIRLLWVKKWWAIVVV